MRWLVSSHVTEQSEGSIKTAQIRVPWGASHPEQCPFRKQGGVPWKATYSWIPVPFGGVAGYQSLVPPTWCIHCAEMSQTNEFSDAWCFPRHALMQPSSFKGMLQFGPPLSLPSTTAMRERKRKTLKPREIMFVCGERRNGCFGGWFRSENGCCLRLPRRCFRAFGTGKPKGVDLVHPNTAEQNKMNEGCQTRFGFWKRLNIDYPVNSAMSSRQPSMDWIPREINNILNKVEKFREKLSDVPISKTID